MDTSETKEIFFNREEKILYIASYSIGDIALDIVLVGAIFVFTRKRCRE